MLYPFSRAIYARSEAARDIYIRFGSFLHSNGADEEMAVVQSWCRQARNNGWKRTSGMSDQGRVEVRIEVRIRIMFRRSNKTDIRYPFRVYHGTSITKRSVCSTLGSLSI